MKRDETAERALRDRIAEIVDPYAFRANALNDRHDAAYRAKAVAKAEAILALPALQQADPISDVRAA